MMERGTSGEKNDVILPTEYTEIAIVNVEVAKQRGRKSGAVHLIQTWFREKERAEGWKRW